MIVLIIENVFVNINNVFFTAHERESGGILASLVDGDTQHLCQCMLVVDEITLRGVCLEHHLQAVTRRGDVHQHDGHAEGRGLRVEHPLRPGVHHLTGIVHMVDVHHAQAVEHRRALLAPCAHPSCLQGGRRLEVGLEDEGGQGAFQAVCLGQHALAALFVDVVTTGGGFQFSHFPDGLADHLRTGHFPEVFAAARSSRFIKSVLNAKHLLVSFTS